MNALSLIVTLIVCFGIYFIPSIVAYLRKQDEKISIFLMNLLLGLTVVGWIVCLIWAMSDSKAAKAKQLNEKKTLGIISEEEYRQKIEKLQK